MSRTELEKKRKRLVLLDPGPYAPGTNYDYWNTCQQEFITTKLELQQLEKEMQEREEFENMELLQMVLLLEKKKGRKLAQYEELRRSYYHKKKAEREECIEQMLNIEDAVVELGNEIEALQQKLLGKI